MYRSIIDGRLEDEIIFLRCYCGGEIISVYYYPPTTTCQEIVALDYYGDLPKNLNKYKHFPFDVDSFNSFISSLEECLLECPYQKHFKNGKYSLGLNKKISPLTELSFYYFKKKAPIKVWGITIRDSELKEFILSLKCIQEKLIK